ncbi:MAG: hypothetical protein KDJ15_02055 [Alphaproteobacteria bacterium]|nr:hypothetical protein [Alphaproteobacteria bacterium]
MLLILYRCHITQDFLALLYGVDKATICRTLRRIEPLARRAIGVKRAINVISAEAQALLIDATEQPVERPQRKIRRHRRHYKPARQIYEYLQGFSEIYVRNEDQCRRFVEGAFGGSMAALTP